MLNLILLEAQAGAEQNPWSFWGMMILIFIVFYFFMIRPQQKKQKELEKQRSEMKKGDKIVTAGGIHGVIKEVKEDVFVVEIAKETNIQIEKASVYLNANEATAQKA